MYSPGRAIDVVYTPAARERARPAGRVGPPGLWGGRVGVVGRVLSSLRVRPDGLVQPGAGSTPHDIVNVITRLWSPRVGQVSARRGTHLPAQDPAPAHVGGEGNADPADLRAHVGDVGDPQLVEAAGDETAVDQIRGTRVPGRRRGFEDLIGVAQLPVLCFQLADMSLLIADVAALIAPVLLHSAPRCATPVGGPLARPPDPRESVTTRQRISPRLHNQPHRPFPRLNRAVPLSKQPKHPIKPTTPFTIAGALQPLVRVSMRLMVLGASRPEALEDFEAGAFTVSMRLMVLGASRPYAYK